MAFNDITSPPVKPIVPPVKPTPSFGTKSLFDVITPKPTPAPVISSADEFVYTITAPPKPIPTPPTPTPTPTPTPVVTNDDVYGDYGEPKTEDENTCPEGYTKNYNRQGKLECLPNYNDIADCGSPTSCTEDEEFVDCKCRKKVGTPDTPQTPTAPTVTKNLKPLLIGAALVLGIVVISKVFKSNS